MRNTTGMKNLVPTTLDRRAFLRAGGAAALAAAATPILSPEDASAAAFSGTLDMLGWDFQPETIKKLVSDWTAKGNPKVNVAIIPNLGYSAAIQTRLRGGDKIDLYYNFAYNSQKFVNQGWASKLNGLPGVDALLGDMFESARARHVTAAGDIISVPYFSAVHMLLYNDRMLKAAGVAAPPQTLKEMYDASKTLQKSGTVAAPYVAFWVKEFCEEYFHTYLLNEGVTAFDEKGLPVFAEDPKTLGVFEWWQTMYQEGLAPKSLLNDDPGKLSNTMAQGNAAFFVLHHYFLTSVRDLAGPASPNVKQAPIGGSNFTLQIGEVLQLGAVKDDDERNATWQLMKYYGWKDEAGKFAVFTQWAKAAGLAAPYPGFFTDPDVVAVFPKYYDLPLISKTFQSGSKVVPTRTMPWYPDFQAKVGDLVHAMLLGQATAKKTVDDLTAAAVAARKNQSL
jgi:multiple sugar transport system substrate-binding protein